jgi:hypothetical protein
MRTMPIVDQARMNKVEANCTYLHVSIAAATNWMWQGAPQVCQPLFFFFFFTKEPLCFLCTLKAQRCLSVVGYHFPFLLHIYSLSCKWLLIFPFWLAILVPTVLLFATLFPGCFPSLWFLVPFFFFSYTCERIQGSRLKYNICVGKLLK